MNKWKIMSVPMRIAISVVVLIVITIAIPVIGKLSLVKSSKQSSSQITTVNSAGVDTHGIDINMLTDDIDSQEQLEQTYQEQLQTGEYTEDNMLVIPDPYGNSPLTALVLFKTEQPAKVTVEVPGATEETTITHTYEEYETDHEITVLGLLSDTTNDVKIIVETEDGQVTEQTVSIQTDALPDYIGTIDVENADTEKMELGESELTFYITSTKYSFAFDTNGDVRWYNTRYNSHVFKELENGHILYLTKDDNSGSTYNELVEMDYLGKYYHVYELSASVEVGDGTESTMIHHDAIELPNNNLLLTVTGATDGDYIEDVMIEVDRETGEIVKSIDMKDLLPSDFYEDYTATEREDGKIDWFHQNAITYDESDNSIIISSRSQDLVMKLDYETDEIKWILADDEDWPDEYEKYLLTATGDDFKFPAAQHATIILPDQDNNDDTIDVLLYDNNTVVTRGDELASQDYSRGVQYRINENDMTVQEVWSFGEDLGTDYFTNIVGSARYMTETKNRLVDFGYMDEGTKTGIFEVTEDGEVVFEAYISDFPYGSWGYRAERFALYGE